MTDRTVALYLRVSSDQQSIEMQRHDLTIACERHGWRIVAEFVDDGISGAKGRDQRPAFDRLHKAIVRREFDTVAAWSVDRLGRSLQHLVAFLGEVHAAGVGLYLHQQGLDTSTPAGRALFQMCGVFAEFERAMIVARVRAGIAKAQERGTRSGKAIGRPKVPEAKTAAAWAALAAGGGIRATARQIGLANGTVHKIAREMRAGTAA
jgi:DNA invertase Pin-like site-specific DNA recombinase